MEEKMQELFSLMREWKELPKYQIERRADIFFALYLPTIWKDWIDSEGFLGDISHGDIIPEFPMKNKENNRSCNIDYAVFCKENVYYVELKTDVNSFKPKQLVRMKEHENVKLALSDALELARSKKDREKYKQVKYDELSRRIKNIKYDEKNVAQICYIGPDALEKNPKFNKELVNKNIRHFIPFSKIIETLKKDPKDKLALLFIKELENW